MLGPLLRTMAHSEAGKRPVMARTVAVVLVALLAAGFATVVVRAEAPPSKMQEPQRFEVDIRDRKVASAMRTLRVTQGEAVEISWTTTEAVEVHLHGYDISLMLAPGRPDTMRFTATVAGRFPLAAHGFGKEGGDGHAKGHKEITLLHFEVHPR
jgi:hypothetical protein